MNPYTVIFPKQIVILVSLSIVLVFLRVILFGNSSFIYLLWNIFLGVLPFLISAFLVSYSKTKTISTPLLVCATVVWLLLLPNAPYLVTDLIHVAEGRAFHLLYNTVLLFTAAYVGVVLYVYSLKDMEKIMIPRIGAQRTTMGIIFTSLVVSFGICLGRFFRFNSWDAITHPMTIVGNIVSIFSDPQQHTQVYVLTLTFFIFLLFVYYAWRPDPQKI